MKYDFFWVFPQRLSANSRRFVTLYRFHLQRPVSEVCRGFGICGVFIPDQVQAGRANGKVSSQLEVVRRGEVYKACAGGITVLYSVAVSFSGVFAEVVSRIC
jgi:hypothetical protein